LLLHRLLQKAFDAGAAHSCPPRHQPLPTTHRRGVYFLVMGPDRLTGLVAGWPRRWVQTVDGLIIGLALAALAGCASTALRSARDEIAAGHYATAHQQLVAARNDPKLSAWRRREIDDDLCLTETKIGAPAYPITEQLSACGRASSEGESRSGRILAEIQNSQRRKQIKEINRAIGAKDLARAEDTIALYQAGAGADPNQVTVWSGQLWAIIDREDADGAKARRAVVRPTIAQMARTYPQARAMSDRSFSRWVEQNMTVGGARMIAGVELAKHTLTLRLADDQLAAAAVNLDRFEKVNDAMVARCGCDGRTNVAIQKTQLPVYLVRLDPATRRSEILVLGHR
jgi:hypothetical protein